MSKFAAIITSLALIGALFFGAPAAVYAVANDIYVGSNDDATGASSCADPDFSTDVSDEGSINAALDAALAAIDDNADIIIICDGDYTYAADITQHDGGPSHDVVNIEAAPGADVTLDGNNLFQLLMFESVTSVSVTGINFLDGETTNYGAAIYVWHGTLSVIGCTFTGNTAKWGGAIYSEPGHVTISGSVFTNNSATDSGGAVSAAGVADGSGVTATDSEFTNNSSANDDGGAINASGHLEVTRSQFSGNSSGESSQGGAIQVEDCDGNDTVSVSGSRFQSNTAGDSGGGAINFDCDTDADVLVSRNIFTGNSARRYGGATDQDDDDFVIHYVRNTFTSNRVTDGSTGGDGEGGAIWVFNATFSGNRFTRNRASAFGGAVYAADSQVARFAKRSRFSGNHAPRGSDVYLSN